MRRLILDAGPIIDMFHAKDRDYHNCWDGFNELIEEGIELLVPCPVVYEIHKWLIHHTFPQQAKETLDEMSQSLTFLHVDEFLFLSIIKLQMSIPNWAGTLEDATVALMAFERKCHVWTLNYRDFGVFETLQFWNP